MDYYCLGFDSTGLIAHVTIGEKWLCESTAKQIQPHYKMVKVVDYEVGQMLIDADLHKWIKMWRTT